MNLSLHRFDASDDTMIWQRFIAGEESAFDQLMSSHFRALFHYGSKFSRDKEFVKDSIQDLFLILWEKRNNLSTDIAVKPYMMASLRRLMHRSMTSQSRLLDEPFENQEGTFEIEFSVEQEYIEHESTLVLTGKLQKLLDELPRRQKEVIYLKFFQELERNQISEIMDVSPQTVSNLLQIAIKQLQKHWKAEFLTLFLIHLFI
ncbi:RNA polymerase sigma factor [Dyadobacter psychrotolerans]|uniref:Sigma-70 family RNA polymerase sigma factor n=1 Tax=Dyadobacter psychrotolerans TaxID=2541721 RepID=A0A4R5DQR4_9BACT|nr:sigma-70 family RNA polymerase sigma factor [Dyadobacter psychrotolerans]TDE13355.1 sigma-70 family RNA polymerase sigma factor [Dyadobacter psychrotolerans]